MSRSKREIPHYYLSTTIDLGHAMAWLAEENGARPVAERLVPAALLLKAVARSLRAYPELNGWWRDGGFVPSGAVHAGVAVALRGGGVIAPALHDVEGRSLDDVMRGLRDLVTRVRGGGLRSSELADATITVTALGDRGVDAVFPVIFPPQVAIVGFGTVVERPWVVTGQVVPRPVVTATLAGDHRVSDGHRGALFLDAVAAALQRPEEL
jgi:pyruvate dehydrogenase E2 component (dihydrolipoamide acetyltransferase)